jgi:hypothetical protein
VKTHLAKPTAASVSPLPVPDLPHLVLEIARPVSFVPGRVQMAQATDLHVVRTAVPSFPGDLARLLHLFQTARATYLHAGRLSAASFPDDLYRPVYLLQTAQAKRGPRLVRLLAFLPVVAVRLSFLFHARKAMRLTRVPRFHPARFVPVCHQPGPLDSFQEPASACHPHARQHESAAARSLDSPS